MNTFPELPLTKLSGPELIRAASTMCMHLSPIKNDSFITRNTAAISAAVDTLRTLDSHSTASEKSGTIEELDSEIDELIPVIYNDLKSNISKKRFTPAKSEASEQIMAELKKRDKRKLIYGSYADQGHELETFFKDVYTADLEEAREVSEILPMLDLLKKRYTVLKDLLAARQHEGVLLTSTREQRQILRFRLDALIGFLQVNIIDAVPGYEAVKTPITQLFTEIEAGVKSRESRKESASAPAAN